MERKRNVTGPDGQEHDAEVLSYQTRGEHWNEYLIDDGTVLRIKLVLTEVIRVEDQYDAQGNPVYVVNSTNVVTADSPARIRRQGG